MKASRALAGVDSKRVTSSVDRASPSPAPTVIARLQRTAGNRSMARLLAPTFQRKCARCEREEGVPAKLTVNRAGDEYEREADRVADAVMRMPDASGSERVQRMPIDVSRKCVSCESEKDESETVVRAKVASPPVSSPPSWTRVAPAVSADLASYLTNTRGGGESLPAAARAFFEPRFGQDFGGVRVHTGTRAAAAAAEIDALAFTTGVSMYFGIGRFNPGTPEGDRLLAHELTHTIQQTGGRPREAETAPTQAEHGSLERSLGLIEVQRARPANNERGISAVGSGATGLRTIQRSLTDLFTSENGDPVVPFDPENPPVLMFGSRGPAVIVLQQILNALSVSDPLLVPDGDFGDRTRDAVLAFQRTRGLGADAIVGPATWGALQDTAAFKESSTEVGTSLGEGPPPLVVGPPFAPLEQAAGCPPYTATELAASKASGGRVMNFGSAAGLLPPLAALVFDFQPGSSEVRGNHDTFLGEIIRRFRLDSPNPIARISVIEGHTDCQGFAAGPEASKGINASIRKSRALAVALRLDQLGARLSNIDTTPEAGGERGPGDDSSPEGRAINRSVTLQLPPAVPPPFELPGPESNTDPGPPLCLDGRSPSENWELQSVVGGGGSIFGFEGEGILFVLHNTAARIGHPAFFTGTGGGVGTPTFAIDIPDRTAFRTLLKTPICASDFDGPAVVTAAEAHLPPPAPPIGFELGNIKLIVPTDPVQIDIGGWQIGAGGSIGVALGSFVVAESIDLPS